MKNNPMGRKLASIRNSAGLTQDQFAEKTGLTQASISKFESGQRTPSLESLCKISRRLEISMNQLLEGVQFEE